MKFYLLISYLKEKSTILDINHGSTLAKKGLPMMVGVRKSSSISMTMKSHRIKNFPTCKGTSSRIPKGYWTNISASCNKLVVGFKSPTCNFLQIEYGMRFTVAPISNNALLMATSLIEQEMEKLPGSESLREGACSE